MTYAIDRQGNSEHGKKRLVWVRIYYHSTQTLSNRYNRQTLGIAFKLLYLAVYVTY